MVSSSLPFFSFLCLLLGLSRARITQSGGHSGGVNGHKDPNWTKICLNGKKQSPIDLVTSHAVCQSSIPPLKFENFDQIGKVLVSNNGETGVIDGFHNWTKRPVFLRELGSRYFLQQIHFHWDMDNKGSEHAVDGKQSAAEMHMVFSLDDMPIHKAKNKSNGLVVFGVLLEVVPGAELGILRDLVRVGDFDQFEDDKNFNLGTKMPKNAEYFRYDGSLTTPDCEENVHWIVFKKPMGMLQSELDALRQLHDHDKFNIDHNNRHVTKINGRSVRLYSKSCPK